MVPHSPSPLPCEPSPCQFPKRALGLQLHLHLLRPESQVPIPTSLKPLLNPGCTALKKQDSESLLTPFFPLQEVAGTEGIVWVHVPFSLSIPFPLSDLSQIEKCLGSFSSDPDTYLKEFKYLTQSYDLTWHDISLYSLLPSSQKRKNKSVKLLRLMPMKYIKLMVLSL